MIEGGPFVLMKSILVFLVVFMTIGVNLPQGMIARLGFNPDYLKVALIAWIITGLVVYRRLALIVLVILLCAGANMPPETAVKLGIDPDIFLATLVGVVIAPYVYRWLELD